MEQRASGVLLPIFSLPSKYGIGCFSKEAYVFVDKLAKAGQQYWQVLPMGPTGYGDSPYQSFSTFAGNPYFIDLETLIKDGLLTKKECRACDFGAKKDEIDYEKLYFSRFNLLKKAYKRFKKQGKRKKFAAFVQRNAFWLEDYALYMAIKDSLGGKPWTSWEEPLKNREEAALETAREELAVDVDFYRFLQFEFSRQWKRLHAYANRKGIRIIGDIPIYVAPDSADAWAAPEMFLFDAEHMPVAVAGCPPDAFSATGQLWGNPLYDWDYMKQTDYAWWVKRLAYTLKLYDVVRIDHFRGFDEFYAIPYGDETAENGKWMPGPGMDLFRALEQTTEHPAIIAEDLGFLTDSVRTLLKDSGFPGMKVLQFAFNPKEESDYLPHNYPTNCVVYTGTHDNDTTRGWYAGLDEETKKYIKMYLYNPDVQRMFSACFLNTLETTVRAVPGDTFIITGDIHAMWLRDSTAQVLHYVRFADDPAVAALIEGLIARQVRNISIDPYANAFNFEPSAYKPYDDRPRASDWVWERKYEIDSLCHPMLLAWRYFQRTGRDDFLTEDFAAAMRTIVKLFKTEQNHRNSPYRFERSDCPPGDTLPNGGMGAPVGITGMAFCGFRPSDDACQYGYLIPANLFAVQELGHIARFAEKLGDPALEGEADLCAREILAGVHAFGHVNHPKYGDILAYETDGLGHFNLMDDANVPSLLSLPYLGILDRDDPLYQRTRAFVLSPDNPYYCAGAFARGVGSPHTPRGYVWPIALCVQAMTSSDPEEIAGIVSMLTRTHAGTHLMHESFDPDDPERFTRPWFAWANSMFGELLYRLYEQGILIDVLARAQAL